jgi:glycosyltransferase involved in cell wall biosynthesis
MEQRDSLPLFINPRGAEGQMRQLRRTAALSTQTVKAAGRNGTKVSVIIPVMNERKTLPSLFRELRKLGTANLEVIVVANGCTDGSNKVAKSFGAKVIHFAEALGHDVGRSIGAKHATGKILLFLDGDMVVPAFKLRSFIRAIRRGSDIALNRYSGPARGRKVHPVVLSKHALNAVLGRADLRGASMTAVPHAMNRKALKAIGAENLTVPPKAQAIAIQKGLKVKAVRFVNVGRLNRYRRSRKKEGIDPLRRLIVGDQLEAIRWLTMETNERGLHTDLMRLRDTVR